MLPRDLFIIIIALVIAIAIASSAGATIIAGAAAIATAKSLVDESSVGESSTDIRALLEREYENWSVSRRIMSIATDTARERDAGEIRAILERWFISWFNSGARESNGNTPRDSVSDGNAPRESNREFPWRARPEMKSAIVAQLAETQLAGTSARDITLKMRDEFAEKRLFGADRARINAVIARILEVAPSDRDRLSRADEVIVSGGTIKIGRMTRNFTPERVALLIAVAQSAGLSRAATQQHLAIAALRYSAIAPGGQQWSIPARAYDVLAARFDADLEGFASPFNSQLLRIRAGARASYCSLFPSIDAPFGSAGDFFECDLRGRVAVINPPFVAAIIESATARAITACADDRATRAFVVVPNWTDAPFYATLSRAACLEHKIAHDKFATFFEDASGRRIDAAFSTTIFILSSASAPRINPDDLGVLRMALSSGRA